MADGFTDTFTDKELRELYPDGRTFYDETGDEDAFVAACHGLGLWPMKHYPPPAVDLAPYITVQVPAEKLYAFYALNMAVGT